MTTKYPDRTATARQRRRTERLAEAGLKKVPVIVPVSREDDIKKVAEKMRDEQKNDLRPNDRIAQSEDEGHHPQCVPD